MASRHAGLLWALPEEVDSARLATFLRSLGMRVGTKYHAEANGHADVPDAGDSSPEELARQWLARPVDNKNSTLLYESLAWAYSLPKLARACSEATWWSLLEKLTDESREAGDHRSTVSPGASQLLGGELAVVLGYLLPEIPQCVSLAERAWETLSWGLVEFLDGEGMPKQQHLGWLRPLLTSWARARRMGRAISRSWSSEAEDQYLFLAQHALRLARRDGGIALQPAGESPHGWREFLPLLFEDAEDPELDQIAEELATRRGAASQPSAVELPPPRYHSEWAGVAVLWPEWSYDAPRLTVAYGADEVRSELTWGRGLFWNGPHRTRITWEGKEAQQKGPWQQICWVGDEDVDYLELESPWSHGLRVQRQILLTREDRFLYWADIVLADQLGKLEYDLTFPLSFECQFHPQDRSHEAHLESAKRRVLALPLGLKEWRHDVRLGEFQRDADHGGLRIQQWSEGRALAVPLFFDLYPRRSGKPFTWRQLTIAERRELQSKDVAVGYRVQVGAWQWLIYRSLTTPANRTVLGQNTLREFLIGRFHRNGTVQPLLEIE